MKISAIALTALLFSAPVAHSSDLPAILTNYETALMRIADKNEADAGSALVMLAATGSRRYSELRDRLLENKDPEVQIAVMHAMMIMGDASPTAQKYLENAVRSPSAQVANIAGPVITSIKTLKVDFERIWDPAQPTYFFAAYAGGWGFVNQTLGIGKARPWKDKAWQQLSRPTQQSLLARAGTKEAVSILIADLKVGENVYLPVAELVDPDYLIELLKHPNEFIRRYACVSLNNGNNSGCADFLRKGLEQEDAQKDLLFVYPPYPNVAPDTLKEIFLSSKLTQQERITRFQWIPWDLLRKGDSALASELAKELLPQMPDRDRSSYELLIMRADNDFQHFPDLIQQVLNMPGDSRSDLRSLMPAASEQERMPDEVADRLHYLLRVWTGRNLGDKPLSFWSEPTSFFRVALQMMGQMARGSNEEQIWNEWRQSKDPLNDYRTFIPVLSNPSKRSEKIRRMIANTWRMTGSGYDLLQRVKAESGPLYVCPQISFLTSQLSYVFWDLTEPVAEASEKLGAKLNAKYGNTEHQFFLDFLQYQGVNVDRSRDQILLDLLNSEESSPPTLKKLIAMEPGPAGANHPWRRMTSYDRVDFFFPDEYRFFSFRRKGNSFAFEKEWNMPRPDLSSDDEAWIRGLIAKEDEERLRQIVDHPLTPSGVESVIGGPSQSGELTLLPEEVLDHAKLLRNSDDLHVRYAVLWSLWIRRHDKTVVETWLQDSLSPHAEVRRMALSVLARIRCKEVTPQILKALEDGNPAFRVLGLRGTQNLRLDRAQPRVLQMLNDVDPTVQQAAASALGYLVSATSRNALIRLADAQTQLGLAATSSLSRYREKEDIDAMIKALAPLEPSSTKANALHYALCNVTFKCAAYLSRELPSPLVKVDAAEWREWWKRHRSQPRLSWLKEAMEEAAEQFLTATDAAAAFKAASRLNSLLGYSVTGASAYGKIDERDRERFRRWWNFEKTQPVWEIFSPSYFDNGSNISFLMQVDTRRTLRHFFPRFLQTCRLNNPSSSDNKLYNFFVDYSGKDYGDPCLASCETKSAVAQDWLKWAQSAGIP